MADNTSIRSILDYARSQADRASCTPSDQNEPAIPVDAFPGYTLLHDIKRGGQGVVYAGVEKTTGRRVAIKVLRSGPFRGRTEHMRFEREIRILARLEHPHIVAIHNSGIIEGHPYYVMDYIPGKPLSEYIETTNLSIDESLLLFLKLCDAIHAAHLKGIVHRDLKPSNIRIDEHGEPRVLDFGLAKPLHEADASEIDATMTGQFVGSLPWAAPEQLANTTEAVDLRTDVYGLGLILYTLLAKVPPFERSSSLRDTVDDILSHDPAPIRTMNPEVDDELATIVSMCLHKEPDRRYQIAGELARDIKRYRAGLPIAAKRDSTGYLLAKTIRRNRGVAALSITLAVSLMAYGVTVSVLYNKAIESEQVAVESRKSMEQKANEARTKYAMALGSLEFLINRVGEDLKNAPQSRAVLRKILQEAANKLSELMPQHGNDPLLRGDLMRAHYKLGELAIDFDRPDKARPHFQEALRLRLALLAEKEPTPRELVELSINHVLVGDTAYLLKMYDECVAPFQAAYEIDKQLVEDYPDNAHYLDNLGWSYNRLGGLALAQGNHPKAVQNCQKQIVIMQQLVDRDPNNPTRLHGLATAHGWMGQLLDETNEDEAARYHHEMGIEVGRRITEVNSGTLLFACNQVKRLTKYARFVDKLDPTRDTSDLYHEAAMLARQILALEPDVTRHRFVLEHTLSCLYQQPTIAGDPEKHEEIAREMIPFLEPLARDSYSEVGIHWLLISCHGTVASVLQKQHRDEEAKEHLDRKLALAKQALDRGIAIVPTKIQYILQRSAEENAPVDELRSILDSARETVLEAGTYKQGTYDKLAECYRLLGDEAVAVEMRQLGAEVTREKDAAAKPLTKGPDESTHSEAP